MTLDHSSARRYIQHRLDELGGAGLGNRDHTLYVLLVHHLTSRARSLRYGFGHNPFVGVAPPTPSYVPPK